MVLAAMADHPPSASTDRGTNEMPASSHAERCFVNFRSSDTMIICEEMLTTESSIEIRSISVQSKKNSLLNWSKVKAIREIRYKKEKLLIQLDKLSLEMKNWYGLRDAN